MEISKETARKFILGKQGFTSKSSNPDKQRLLETIRSLGCVQIDTINVVERSHYLVLWSRWGAYNKTLLDQLLYPDRKVFEYWAHAASIIPMEHYRYFIPSIKKRRKNLKSQAKKWLKEKEHLVNEVLEKIQKNGPVCSKDFADERKGKRQGWWDWKPAKIALELLFNTGFTMVNHRDKFQRYYDLTERVLPSNVDKTEPSEEEQLQSFLLNTVNAWGLVRIRDFSDYYYRWSTRANMKIESVRNTIQQLVESQVLAEVRMKGMEEPLFLFAKDLGNIDKIENNKSSAFEGVTFLSPFDNMVWGKSRVKEFFDFSPKLEAYVPKEKRKYGYYTLNILYKDGFVGRLDPKFHRGKKLLEVKSLHLEEGFNPDEEFKEKLAVAFQSFLRFLNAEEISFSERCPRALANLM